MGESRSPRKLAYIDIASGLEDNGHQKQLVGSRFGDLGPGATIANEAIHSNLQSEQGASPGQSPDFEKQSILLYPSVGTCSVQEFEEAQGRQDLVMPSLHTDQVPSYCHLA